MYQRQSQPGSSGRRQHPGQGKAARPNLNRRVHSYHSGQSHSQAASKTTTPAAKKAAREETKQADDEEGMAGLPQFCMTCERQIVNPANSTLYCSRACQRRDSAKETPIEPVASPAFISAPSYFDVPQPDILPQRSPTVLRPVSLTFSDLHLSDSGSPTDDDSALDRRRQRLSDATRYYGHPEHDDSTSSFALSRRPHATRSSTSTLPSLCHTPSSSVGTAASFSSYRPLPPRRDPMGCHRSIKSADLVIPTFAGPSSADASVKSCASTLTSFCAAEAVDVTYAKHDAVKQQHSPAKGSLRQLFGHEAMASTPKASNTGLK